MPAEFYFARFGVDTRLIEELIDLALSQGAEYADLFFEYRRGASYLYEDQAVKNVSGGVEQGVGIRAVSGEATGYAYSEDFDPESLRRVARTAAAICRENRSAPPVHVEPGERPDRYRVVQVSVDADVLTKLSLLRRADAAARSADPSVAKVIASFSESDRYVAVATSTGALITDHQPMIALAVQVMSERGDSRQTGSANTAARTGLDYFDGHTPETIATEAVRRALVLHDAVEAPAGTFPVVLEAGHSGVLLHEAIGHGLEADFNRKQTSNYSNRVGELVASPLCTIVDDATLDHSRGSINVDDEGVAGKYNVLIEKGILKGYLQDRMSAKHFGLEPSGNGRRESFQLHPMPRMTNTYLLAGESDPEDLVKAVDYGLYCTSFSGGQVNISNGDFVFAVTEAYLIEGGRKTAPVRNVTLIGNGPDSLSKVTMVGSDFKLSDGGWTCGKEGQSVPVGVGMPSVLVSGITVGGTKHG